MENLKHTPGNWLHSVVNNSIKIVVQDGPAIITGSTDLSFRENVANAKLMAASPELLEALKEIVAIARFENNRILSSGNPMGIGFMGSVERAEAAIEKCN